jgi:transposase
MSASMSNTVRQNPTHPTPQRELSGVQQQVVAALTRGCTITAAAAEAQVHRSTIHEWLNTIPSFRAALTEARSQYAAQLRDEMKDLSASALETLRTLLQDSQTPHGVRLKAALGILQRRDWSLPADAERNLDREIKEQLLALGSDPLRIPRIQAQSASLIG